MQSRAATLSFPVVLLSLFVLVAGGLFWAGSARAQSSLEQPAPTAPMPSTPAADAPQARAGTAAAPEQKTAAEPVVLPSDPTEAVQEQARAKTAERREIISQGIGISVEELDDLLSLVQPQPGEQRLVN